MTNQGTVAIGNRLVGPGQPTFIIAEIGINHNGDLAMAKRLIDVAAFAGCDAVKFQKRTISVVYSQQELDRPREMRKGKHVLERAIERGVLPPESVQRLVQSDFSDTHNGDFKYALEFTENEYALIDAYCKEKQIAWLASCWDCESVDFIEQFNPPAHKIASPCNEDDELMLRLRATGKPLILSTGMTDMDGVRAVVEVLGTEDLVILHCTSIYPTGTGTPEEVLRCVNLKGMNSLRDEFGVPVGFSSHDTGIMPTFAAVAMGACMIEKHVTQERGMFGSDQALSSEPGDLIRLCRAIRELHMAQGDGEITIYPDEQAVIEKLRRVRRHLSVV